MVRAHEIDVVIPEDHRLTVEVPRSVRSGPARMILLTEETGQARPADPEALARWQTLVADLEDDPRPFDELSQEERQARLRRVMGSGRGISSSSEEFARRKAVEIELEESKFAR